MQFFCLEIMLDNTKFIPLRRVFHGIRFKVNKVDCRETINFFLPTLQARPPWRNKYLQNDVKSKLLLKFALSYAIKS